LPDPDTRLDAKPVGGIGRTLDDRGLRLLVGGAVTALLIVVCGVTLLQAGVAPLDLARYAGYLAGGVVLPGFVLHRTMRGAQRGWLAEIVYAGATGLLAGIPVWVAASTLDARDRLWIWPVAAVALVAVPAVRRRVLARPSAGTSPLAAAGIGVAAVAAVLAQRSFFTSTPYPLGHRPYYADLLWHMSLASEAMRSFPLQTPQVATSGALHYHWFAHADMALASMMSGVDVPVLVLRLWPLALTLLVIGIVAVLAQDLSGRPSTGALAALIVVTPVILSPWMTQLGYQDLFRAISPTQIYSYVPLLMALAALASLVRTADRRVTGPIALLLLSVLVGAGAKPTVLPLLAGGALTGLVAALFLRRSLLPFVVLLVAIVPAYAVSSWWTSGSVSGSRPSLLAIVTLAGFVRESLPADALSREGPIIPGMFDDPRMTAAVILSACIIVLRPLLGLAPVFQRELRRDSTAWALSGVCGAGVAAALVIGHPGYSELYFAQAAAPVGAILGSWWLVAAVGSSARRRVVAVSAAVVGALVAVAGFAPWPSSWSGTEATIASLAIAAVAVAAVCAIVAAGAAVPWTRRGAQLAGVALLSALIATIIVSTPFGGVAAAQPPASDPRIRDEYAAGAWIADHTPADSLFAVNDHCVGAETADCDARIYWLSGLGGRRVLIEGWAYDGPSTNEYPVGAVHPPHDAALLRFNQSLFEAPTPELLAQAADRGVDYLVATAGETEVSPDLDRYADRVFQNDTVTIYRLR
jgi:hypothetical protein